MVGAGGGFAGASGGDDIVGAFGSREMPGEPAGSGA
jgi:hypothetical protein